MNWSTRVRDLQARGMTLAAIGEKVGLSTSAVGDLATGYRKEPRGEAALALDALHRERCKRKARRGGLPPARLRAPEAV
mgnify:CR=1 FL=1